MSEQNLPYVHGFSDDEQERLRKHALFAEYSIYQNIDLTPFKNLLEVGSGVGAQTEIILRRYPQINISCIDLNDRQIESAKKYLASKSYTSGRYNIEKMNAMAMTFTEGSFDAAFMCWILEHVPDPLKVLTETKRVLKPGSRIYINEVMNHSFFLNPYSPNLWKFWMAFNDYQYDHAGDPFIGAKLGNLLSAAGFKQIKTTVKTWHFDNRSVPQRKVAMKDWFGLMISAEKVLLESNYLTAEVLTAAKKEIEVVKNDPNAVFFESFMQAEAEV